MKGYLTTAEVAAMAGVAEVTVRQWSRRHGDFPENASAGQRTAFWPEKPILVWLKKNGKIQ